MSTNCRFTVLRQVVGHRAGGGRALAGSRRGDVRLQAGACEGGHATSSGTGQLGEHFVPRMPYITRIYCIRRARGSLAPDTRIQSGKMPRQALLRLLLAALLQGALAQISCPGEPRRRAQLPADVRRRSKFSYALRALPAGACLTPVEIDSASQRPFIPAARATFRGHGGRLAAFNPPHCLRCP
jgi:hypothetical protein